MPPKKLGLVGLLVAFLVALPIFVWSIINLNFNPKEKASEIIELSICNDACNLTSICLNEGSWPQELTCYPEDSDNGLCRNKACPDQPNCICPTVPQVVSCNETCNYSINPPILCEDDKSCFVVSGLKGGYGVCRNVNCSSETDCNCSTPTATPTATPTIAPTATATAIATGVPNYCGGTCGSNFNCQANYYCYSGFCRNPVCPSDSNCDCIANVTATATPKKTATAKPVKTATVKPTSTTVGITSGYKTSTPKSSATSSPTLHPALIEKKLENQFFTKYALPIFGVFVLVVISTIFYALKKTRKTNQIPHITPPVNV